jgi:glutamate dehydrogenase
MALATAEVASSSPADICPQYQSALSCPRPIEDFPAFDHTLEEVMTDLHHSPISNKLVGQVAREYVSRTPSPRSTHSSVPNNGNGNGHRILRSAKVGYVAPEFKGKKDQMMLGECPRATIVFLTNS